MGGGVSLLQRPLGPDLHNPTHQVHVLDKHGLESVLYTGS